MEESINLKEYNLLSKYLDNPISNLVLAKDKKRFHTKEGFIAYGELGNLAVALGEPICKSKDQKKIITDFICEIEKRGQKVVFVCTLDQRDAFHSSLFNGMCIGEDAIIRLPFAHSKKIERAAKSARRRSVVVEKATSMLHLRKELAVLDDKWISRKKTDYLTFTINNDFYDLENCYLYIAYLDKKIVGYSTVFFFHGMPAYIDITRTVPNAPNGTSELMIKTILDELPAHRVKEVSLGCVFASQNLANDNPGWIRFIQRAFYDFGGFIYPSKDQNFFKNKFNPVWVPSYMYWKKNVSFLELSKLFYLLNPSGFFGILRKYLHIK